VGGAFFVNSALKIQWHAVKNTLLQTAFSAIWDLIEQSPHLLFLFCLQKSAHLKFKYMEEDAAEEFFIPYIWSIVYKSSYLYWNAEKIVLFHPV